MSEYNFIHDRAIENSSEDELNRTPFANKLKDSLTSWEDEESIVISIKGEWGEGKSSVINLIKEKFKKDNNSKDPTIIEFNPWAYADNDSLSFHFFNDISTELRIKNDDPNDTKLAKSLKLYSQLINITNETRIIKDIIPNLIVFLGLLGVSTGKLLDWINITPIWVENILFIFGLVILLIQLFSGFLNKIATYLELKALSKDKSPQTLKEDIIKHLKERNTKLLIVIDDIDRLSQKEIREIFKLIRVNADFPNTIYLLAYDNNIIERNLEEQKGISGKDYLKKIVQVDFNLPYIKTDKIHQYLFNELDKILAKLPKSVYDYFNPSDQYWANTFHSGYKDFFSNIRDVKRYINSLLFNLNLLHREEIFEVNPIDFFALEALRVFTPDFYDFIKFRKDLFTDMPDDNQSNQSTDKRKNEINEGFKKVDEKQRVDVKQLINHLFPQLDPIIKESGGMHYSKEFISIWRKELKICSKAHFNSYFTLNPEENESELTEYDIQKFLQFLDKPEIIETNLKQFIDNKKIRPLLSRLEDYTKDEKLINKSKNLIQALNNISDIVSNEREGMFDLGANMEVVRVIFQLLINGNQNSNYNFVKELIDESKGIYGLLNLISIQTAVFEKNPEDPKLLFTEKELLELQKSIMEKIEKQEVDQLLENNNFLYIINHWKDWGDNDKLQQFVGRVKEDEGRLLKFIKHFISTARSRSVGSYGEQVFKQIDFNNMERFTNVPELVKLIKGIRVTNEEDSTFIDKFFKDYNRYYENPEAYKDFNFR